MSVKSMSAKSLLPCSCGKKIEVEISQAGLLVDCPACGKQVQTPTLRGFRELERVETPQNSTRSGGDWGTRQGLVFLGLTITLIGLLAAVTVWWTSPVFNPAAALGRKDNLNRFEIERLSPSEAYSMWDGLTITLDDPREQSALYAHAAIVKTHYRWMPIALGVSVMGLLVTFGGLVVGSTAKKR
jgi:hypothetical protein